MSKQITIYGTTQSGMDEYLVAYISKYGYDEVFGSVVEKCCGTGNRNIYSFAFQSHAPTDEQRIYLERHTFSVYFEDDLIDGI